VSSALALFIAGTNRFPGWRNTQPPSIRRRSKNASPLLGHRGCNRGVVINLQRVPQEPYFSEQLYVYEVRRNILELQARTCAASSSTPRLQFFSDLLLHLVELGDAAVNADALALVQLSVNVALGDTLGVT